MESRMKSVYVTDLGATDYKSCWDLQQRLFTLRTEGKIPDILLLTEHHHVYTIGKTGDANHLLANETDLRDQHIDLYYNDRGGDITYHGPGQLVGYPILDLNNFYLDLHRYLRDLEEVVIRTLETYGVTAHREPGYTGVWVENEKICAIGVKSGRWVTMHGFAFNVNTDLSFFNRIIPCGIFEKGVTSLEAQIRDRVGVAGVAGVLVGEFARVFGVETRTIRREGLYQMMESAVTTAAA